MKTLPIDYRLKGEYLETFHIAEAYLALKNGYIKDVDPAIAEVKDLLLQAQEDNEPVPSVFGDDLIRFLRNLEMAFTATPMYRRLYGVHTGALIMSLGLRWLFRTQPPILDLYAFFFILFAGDEAINRSLKWYLGRQIQRVDSLNIRRMKRYSMLLKIVSLFVMSGLLTSDVVTLPWAVSTTEMLWLLGVTLIPIIVISIVHIIRTPKHEKGRLKDSLSSEIQPSSREMVIQTLEKKFLKENVKREKKQLPPLSDHDLVKKLSREKKILNIIHPVFILGYLGFIGFLITMQVRGSFSWEVTLLIVFLIVIGSVFFGLGISSQKDVSVFIYYLDKRNQQTFTTGAVPLDKLNKKYKELQEFEEAKTVEG